MVLKIRGLTLKCRTVLVIATTPRVKNAEGATWMNCLVKITIADARGFCMTRNHFETFLSKSLSEYISLQTGQAHITLVSIHWIQFWGFFSGHPKNTSDNLNYMYSTEPLENILKTIAKEIGFRVGFEQNPKHGINSEQDHMNSCVGTQFLSAILWRSVNISGTYISTFFE